jgi:uncharacterized membrane protein YgcG
MSLRQRVSALSSALALVALLLCAVAFDARAQGQSIRIRDFDALLAVHSDGSVDVTEQLTIRFNGEWHGINRDISLRHNTAQGRGAKLKIQVGYITDSLGNRLRVDESNLDNGWTHRLKIYIPDAINADRQIIIRYRVANAIRFYFGDGNQYAFDELYWNVTGNGWTMPIDSAHARVELPSGVTATRTAVYTGPAGSVAADATIAKENNAVDFTLRHGLYAYEGMTIGVGWPAGHIAGRPSPSQQLWMDIMQWTPLLLPLIVFVLAYRQWDKKGRDPEEGSFLVRYEPVAGASPAELGTLIDNTADMPDITATLVDLAVRGYVHITELTEEHLFGLTKSKDYQIDIIRKRAEWKELKGHEQNYLDALGQAAPRDVYSVKMSELKNRFYKFLPAIRNAIYDELVGAEYYIERPDATRAKWLGLTVVVAIATIGFSILSVKNGWMYFAVPALVVAAVLSTLTLAIFAQIMPARTPQGARAREAALGFKEFLSRVEEDRYKKMITSPDLFERYLPYAMAFGVADKWAKAFEDIYREPPQWYSGSQGSFNAIGFSHSINSMSSAAASSMSSSPSSSGSGGGGSSGGGSGGGGGSGF